MLMSGESLVVSRGSWVVGRGRVAPAARRSSPGSAHGRRAPTRHQQVPGREAVTIGVVGRASARRGTAPGTRSRRRCRRTPSRRRRARSARRDSRAASRCSGSRLDAGVLHLVAVVIVETQPGGQRHDRTLAQPDPRTTPRTKARFSGGRGKALVEIELHRGVRARRAAARRAAPPPPAARTTRAACTQRSSRCPHQNGLNRRYMLDGCSIVRCSMSVGQLAQQLGARTPAPASASARRWRRRARRAGCGTPPATRGRRSRGSRRQTAGTRTPCRRATPPAGDPARAGTARRTSAGTAPSTAARTRLRRATGRRQSSRAAPPAPRRSRSRRCACISASWTLTPRRIGRGTSLRRAFTRTNRLPAGVRPGPSHRGCRSTATRRQGSPAARQSAP